MTGSPGQPDGPVLVLAREVEQLRREVERVGQVAAGAKETADTAVRAVARGSGERDSVRAELGRMAGQVAAVSAAVERLTVLAGQVAGLAGQVSDLAQRLGVEELGRPAPARPALPSWFEVDDAEQAERLLADLVEWVDTVLVRHAAARTDLPVCWMFHGEVVEDLLWLRAAWLAAHRDPAARPHHAADFHERWLPGVMDRLRRSIGMCSVDNHRGGPVEHRLREEQYPEERIPAVEVDSVAGYARWWAHYRGRTDVAPPGVPVSRPRIPRGPRPG